MCKELERLSKAATELVSAVDDGSLAVLWSGRAHIAWRAQSDGGVQLWIWEEGNVLGCTPTRLDLEGARALRDFLNRTLGAED